MSTFNRNTLAAALAVSLASLVSAPAMATGTVTGSTSAPFAHEVTGKGTGAAVDPLAVAQGFGFSLKAPDILIGRTDTSGDVTVFVTFSGADVATAPLPGDFTNQGTLGAISFGGNVLQFTISPPLTPGFTATSLFTINSLSFKNALSLQPNGGGINATVRIVDTNTNIELLPNTSGKVLSGAYATDTAFGPKTNLTVDVTQPSQKTQFLGPPNTTWAQIGTLSVSLNDFTVDPGPPVVLSNASTDGTGAVTNDSNGAAAGGTFVFDAAGDVVDLTVTIPSPAAFVTIPASGSTPAAPAVVYADTAACGDLTVFNASGTAVELTQSTTNPQSFSALGLPLTTTGETYNICVVANGVSTISNQIIHGNAQVKLAGALTIDPPAADADIAEIGFNGTVVNVATFNPAGNTTQESFLRVSNTSTIDGLVTVEGIDDKGNPAASAVTFNLAAGNSLQFNSNDLENGNAAKFISGAFGPGTIDGNGVDVSGKWRLIVTGEFSGMKVSSLNRNNTTGTLADLSAISNTNQ